MRLLRRLLAAVVLVLAMVGAIACVAALIGIWRVRAEVDSTIDRVDAALGAGIERASGANHRIQEALEKARADVERTGDEAAKRPEPGGKSITAGLRRRIQERLGPSIDEVGARLAGSADAAVAVASLLQSVHELPLGDPGSIRSDMLERASDKAAQLGLALRKLHAALGDGEPAITGKQVAAATRDVDLALERCQAIVNDWQSELDKVREAAVHLTRRIRAWVNIAAIAATLLCVWVGASQVSLLAHAWKWFRAR